MPADQDLPLALVIREDGDEDTYLATVEHQGDSRTLELDDGRTLTVDWESCWHACRPGAVAAGTASVVRGSA